LLAESYDTHDMKRLFDGAYALSSNTPTSQPTETAGVVQAPTTAGATP
jgi:hypothetical protein